MEVIVKKVLCQNSSIEKQTISLLFALLFLIVGLCAPANGAFNPDEEAPVLQQWSTMAKYHWIFTTTALPDDITISINDHPLSNTTLELKKYKGVVHGVIPLQLEKSNLIVAKINNEVVFTVDLFYAKSYHNEIVPEEYETYLFHTSKTEAPCLLCHRLEPNKADLKPLSPADSICYTCHKDNFPAKFFFPSYDKSTTADDLAPFSDVNIIAKNSQHTFAVAAWLCLNCHQAEAIESEFIPDTFLKFTIKEGTIVAPLCYSCHPERKKKNEAYSHVHGPIGMGGCNMCHNPHFSNFDKLLEDKPTKLCIDCHELKDMLAKKYVHAPLLLEGCITCHDPHGSNFSYQLLSDIPQLCYRCHKDIAKQKNNHPITGHPTSAPKDPRDPDLSFSCISCHDPHSADYEYLLPEEGMLLCIECHKIGA